MQEDAVPMFTGWLLGLGIAATLATNLASRLALVRVAPTGST
jgi:hypothetical protein